MFNPSSNFNSMMPVMPPPGSVKPPPTSGASPTIKFSIDINRFQGIKRITVNKEDVAKVSNAAAPTKMINSETDLQSWLSSDAFQTLMRFVIHCNESVKNTKISSVSKELSENLKALNGLFDVMSEWTREIPLQDFSAQRFGNLAFRDWHTRLEQNSLQMIQSILSKDNLEAFAPELNAYFTGAFGDRTRIDYGSGHETSFVAFLACLDRLDFIKETEYNQIVLIVFVKYLEFVRHLQRTYRLEPAGSHGVWGLDDYQFVPFLWGSSQLLDHRNILPKTILNQEIVATYAKEYMYLSCINFINEMKKGPFFEHSPMLYDISGVPNWGKVNTGMIKMYLNEVLCKVPVIQHFPFGYLLSFDSAN